MNHRHKAESSSSSSSPSASVSSVDNESTLSDTFSFAPDGGYQSMLHSGEPVATPVIQGPGKLAPRRSHDMDNGGEFFELEHTNGRAHLKVENSCNRNGQGLMDNGKAHSGNGAVRVGSVEFRSDESHPQHITESKSASALNPFVTNPLNKPSVSMENGRSATGEILPGSELRYKLEQEGPRRQSLANPPHRQLLATTSAPVRLAVNDVKHLSHHPDDGLNDNGSECSSPDSSKSDLQSLSDQTGGATCGSGAERSLVRTKSLPSRSFSEADDINEYRRSHTQSGGRRNKPKKIENQNVRLVAQEKLSDRKKKKLMKNLATIQKDGTVEFDVAGSARIASNLFGPGIFDEGGEVGEEEVLDEEDDRTLRDIPPLQIVMLIVGTRGDVQPFVAIGKHLQEYGHRVRLATHTNFREFVMTAGLEFYPLGGDPKVLAGYMVKNKGFLPSGPGEIQVQRKQIKAIINSLLPACTATDTEFGSGVPFRAQAIIANPPAYGHVHVAEYLQVPLHIFFTMPWTATSQFPHPLSRVKSPAGYRAVRLLVKAASSAVQCSPVLSVTLTSAGRCFVDRSAAVAFCEYKTYLLQMSYQVVDSLIWWGIRSMINDFRKKKLKLRPITYLSGSQGSIAELPTGYIWSPHLVPKPRDWGPLVDVVGFCFLNLAQDYKPPKDLLQWLKAGPAPIYVGFGSLPVVDPKGMTNIIVKALEVTHQRGIIFKGWGGMGELNDVPQNIFLIEDCPHDWLFKQCAAVVHHGGAGTTAAGLKAACPTTVVPFFGDQPFWGDQIHAKGIGPPPIMVDQFSLDKLVKAIEYMLKDEVKQRAMEIAKAMEGENGVEGAVVAFHKHLPRDTPQPAHTHPPDTLRYRVFRPFKTMYNCFT